MIAVGMLAPDFSLPDQSGKIQTLSSYRGKWVLVYFYPKDDTPGCTTEACSLRDTYEEYQKSGIVVLGMSPDPVKKHIKFSEKYSLPFLLLSDETKATLEKYGVWGLKKFMGREYMGVLRTSYLIDPTGVIRHGFEKVDVGKHAQEVLAVFNSMEDK